MLSIRPDFLKALAVTFTFSLAKAIAASVPSNICTGPILHYVAFLTSCCRAKEENSSQFSSFVALQIERCASYQLTSL